MEELSFKAWSIVTSTMSPREMTIPQWIAFVNKQNQEFVPIILDKIIFLQYIGRTDKEDRRLFVGDLINGDFQNEFNSYTKEIGIISYCPGCSRYVVRKMKKHKEGDMDVIQVDEQQHWSLGNEIIKVGNVFENPELVV